MDEGAFTRGRIKPALRGAFAFEEPLNSGEIISTPSDSALGARGDLYPLAKYRTPDGREGVDVAWPRMLVPSPGMDRPEDGFKALMNFGLAKNPAVPTSALAGSFTLNYFGKPIRILENPSPKQLQGFLGRTKYKAARRIVDPDTGAVYVWDADNPALHKMVADELGVKYDPKRSDMIGLDD